MRRSSATPRSDPVSTNLKFGLGLVCQFQGLTAVETHAALIDQAEAAAYAGFDGIFVTEHHQPPTQGDLFLQPLPTLAELAARFPRIDVGAAVLVAPLYQPMRLVEDLTTLAAQARDRLVIGLGAGFDAREFNMLGVDYASRFRLLETAAIDIRGALDAASLVAPVWIAGTTPRSIRRAALHGDAWLPADTAGLAELAAGKAVHAGVAGSSAVQPLMREAFVGDRASPGRAIAERSVIARYRRYWDTGDPQLRAEFPDGLAEFDELARGRFVFGSPDECVGQIEMLQQRLSVTYLVLRIARPALPLPLALRAIRDFGESVISRFR